MWDPCREEEAAAGTAKVRTLQTSFSKNSHEAPAREPGALAPPRSPMNNEKAIKESALSSLLPTLM